MARGKDKTDKLIQYIKDDRPRKFKACVKKYGIDISKASLPKGRTFLHYAADYGLGSLIHFLLERGVSASKQNHKGDLPLHVAVARALKLHASDASEVYFDVVTPLLEAYPLALDVDDHHGNSGQELLQMLKDHLKKPKHEHQQASSSSCLSPDDEWKEKLATEFESKSADFFGRYNDYESDFAQERQKETNDEWADRMWREHQKQHYQTSHRLPSRHSRKRRTATENSENFSNPSSSKKTALDEEELRKVREKMQEAYKLQKEKEKRNQYKKKRTAYETHYQKILTDKSTDVLRYDDIPWPGTGSIDSVMDVLFSDLGIKCKTALKKYVRQQQVRWHPDKFLQKFGERIEEQSRAKVMERVKQISQAINKRAETALTDDS